MSTQQVHISSELKKYIDDHLTRCFPISDYCNVRYSKSEIVYTLLDAIGSKKFVTARIDEIEGEGVEVASSSTIFKRLHKLKTSDVINFFGESNESILNYAMGCGTFGKPMIVAIDKHDMAWYGKKDRVELVGVRNRRGTELGYRYATIESVEEFKRFTFA
ncbi:MAG: hypothetical protein QXO11_04705, partial [Thermoplasmata archaeon]